MKVWTIIVTTEDFFITTNLEKIFDSKKKAIEFIAKRTLELVSGIIDFEINEMEVE